MDKIQAFINNPRSFKIAGTTLIGIGLFLLGISKRKKARKQYKKEKVIEVLKKLKRNYYPIYRYLRKTSDKITSSYKIKYEKVPQTLLKYLDISLISENSQCRKMILEIEGEVYSNLQIEDKEGFQESVNRYKKSDKEVKDLVELISDNFFFSCKGISFNLNISLPKHVNMRSTLEIYKKYVCAVLKAFNEYKQETNLQTFDFQFNKMMISSIDQNKIKQNLLTEKNFDFSDNYHEENVFEAAITQFMEKSQEFKDIIFKIDSLNGLLLQLHLDPNADLEKLGERIKEIEAINLEMFRGIQKEKLENDLSESQVKKIDEFVSKSYEVVDYKKEF